MKLDGILFGVVLLLVVGIFSYASITSNVVSDFEGPNYVMGDQMKQGFDEGPQGPSVEEIECMQSCVSIGCELGDKDCMVANSEACGLECNVDASGPPKPENEGESCMQECILVGCDKFDFKCQNQNMNNCEIDCNMKGDAPDESDMSKEQKCISDCVMKKDPNVICGNSKEGETGGRICRKCAKKCEYLYDGPCLNDKQIKKKEKECKTCNHCYGKPVEGASGQGWDCIIDIECLDASTEFGDEAGEGPGIGQDGYVNKESFTERIGGFFKGFFKGNNK